ncbi:ribosomal protein S18-alanine N-acetyltransferase [Mailhella sp.]|uniref:ribosomal protein S18-alanine N-acetyltransferase n=1 Tax=Mailhella sp. TaxID=1981029 RepID=UPI003AB38439
MENIRWLSREDMASVAVLEARCFSSCWTSEQFDKAWRQDWFAGYGMFHDSELVGYITLSVLAGELEVLNIAILPEERGKGLSRPLMCYALNDTLAGNHRKRKRLFPQSWECAVLEVRVGNAPARALYASLGFVQTGVRKRYYSDGEDAVVMTATAEHFRCSVSRREKPCAEKTEK